MSLRHEKKVQTWNQWWSKNLSSCEIQIDGEALTKMYNINLRNECMDTGNTELWMHFILESEHF